MDISKLSTGQRIAGGAGVLLFIDLFLSWYSFGSVSADAWRWFSWIDLICAATAIVAVLAAAQARGILQVPASMNMILLPLAAVATILVLYRLINQPGPNSAVSN